MSSVNPHFTFNYVQPEEYRFSHDSVFLARRVFEMMDPAQIKGLRGLDLCAGCGIIGLDFAYHCAKEFGTSPSSFDFFEVQKIYENYFAKNVEASGISSTDFSFVLKNYAEILNQEFTKQYDLIVCNPPYFRMGQGRLSPSEFKNRCRFYIDSDFKTLLLAIKKSLSPEGVAYILLRDLTDHGFKAEDEARAILGDDVELRRLEEIRGTGLVSLRRK